MINNRSISILNYALKERRKWFLVLGFFIVLYALRLIFIPVHSMWKENFEAIVAGATLLAAVVIAFSSLKQDWEGSLPKRLTVIFTYHDLPVMKCEEAWLAGESDIRQWSQQIGKQMADGEYLEFEPFVNQKDEVVERGEEFVKLYTATFKLTKVPKKFENNYREGYPLWRWSKTENKTIEIPIKHDQA
jgi:hypothetical protein